MMTLERLIISCGGTGGHFNPGLSIAREFKKRGGDVVLFLGGKHAEKQALTAKNYGIESVRVEARPFSKNPVRAVQFLYATIRGISEANAAFRKLKPQAVLSMGSYTSLPPVLAAHHAGIPIFLHDGNARLGRANKFLSRFAKAIALSFPTEDAAKCKCPSILTGMPLRQEIVSGIMTKKAAIEEINARWIETFSPDKPTILIFGGSLGAATLNMKARPRETMPGIEKLQIIRLVGPGKLESVKPLYAGSKVHDLIIESCQDMNLLYSAADLVISRSGGSTVSELAVYGKYALLLPYPFAADNHQEDNARWLASAGGATIMEDSLCTEESITLFLEDWLTQMDSYLKKGLDSKKLAMPDAASRVVDMIDNILSVSTKEQ